MIISRYSLEAREFAGEMQVPSVVFYEDMRDFYSKIIYKWEGK
jgi:hypothetical protein